MNVRGVILAAGLGRRMGAVKQLLPLHGRPLLQHVIDAARASTLAHLALVLGNAHAEILSRIDARGVDIVLNPDFASGQSTSVRAGLTHGPDADGVMFLLGDQPLVDAPLIDLLVTRFLTELPWALVPVHEGRPGNPAIIGREMMRDAQGLTGDVGARKLLRDNPRHVQRIEIGDPAVLRDVDTMDDYLSLLAMRRTDAEDNFRP
ncbi:nucleotidyltransferase family protein [Desulfomicrobium salsuginis]